MVEIVQSKLIKYPHGFSTRIGGVSTGIYSSLNLGMNRGDDRENVTKNWHLFLEACGISGGDFVCGKQIHENRVYIATAQNSKPAYCQGELIEADGYATNVPNVPLAIFTADCTPLLLADEKNQVIAAVHCGWRSTVADIEKNAIDAMLSLGADITHIKASMGPSIGICCFEVGPEVIDAATSLIGTLPKELVKNSINPGKYMLDLPGVVKIRLMQLGVLEHNIEIINECTHCHPEKYWSHRYGQGKQESQGLRGSQANVIMIQN